MNLLPPLIILGALLSLWVVGRMVVIPSERSEISSDGVSQSCRVTDTGVACFDWQFELLLDVAMGLVILCTSVTSVVAAVATGIRSVLHSYGPQLVTVAVSASCVFGIVKAFKDVIADIATFLRDCFEWAWNRYIMRRFRVGKVQRKKWIEMSGSVASDAKGYYISCHSWVYGAYKVRPNTKDGLAVLAPAFSSSAGQVPAGQRNEMCIPGAVMTKIGEGSTNRAGVVALRLPGGVFSMASRIIVPGLGSNLLLTSAHSLAVALAHPVVTIEHKGYTLKCDFKDMFLKSKTRVASKRLDVVIFDVPAKVWSTLGVKALGVTPATSHQCEAYGYELGTDNFCASTLSLVGRTFCRYTHEGATHEGWSGTPIICKGKVVGIHTGMRADRRGNWATEVYPLVAKFDLRESAAPMQRWQIATEEFEGPEEYSVDVKYDDDTVSYKVRGKKYLYTSAPGGGPSWEDMFADEMDFDSTPIPSWKGTEAALAQSSPWADFPKGRVPPSASKLEEVEAEVRAAKVLPTPPPPPLVVPVETTSSVRTDAESPRDELQSSEVKALEVLRRQMAGMEQKVNLLVKSLETLTQQMNLLLLLPNALQESALVSGPTVLATSLQATPGIPNVPSPAAEQECPSPSSDVPASSSQTAGRRRRNRLKRKGGDTSTKTSGNGTGPSEAQPRKEPASSSKPESTELPKGPTVQRPSESSVASLGSILEAASPVDLRKLDHLLKESRRKGKSPTSATSTS